MRSLYNVINRCFDIARRRNFTGNTKRKECITNIFVDQIAINEKKINSYLSISLRTLFEIK